MLLFKHNVGDIRAESVYRIIVPRSFGEGTIRENDESDAAFGVDNATRPRESRFAEGARVRVPPHEARIIDLPAETLPRAAHD